MIEQSLKSSTKYEKYVIISMPPELVDITLNGKQSLMVSSTEFTSFYSRSVMKSNDLSSQFPL